LQQLFTFVNRLNIQESLVRDSNACTKAVSVVTFSRVHSKLKGQNSRTFQALLKDLKLQFSSTKRIDKKDISYSRCDHNHITFKTVLKNVNKQIICNTHWDFFNKTSEL